MNPVTRPRLTLFSQHKARHLEAEDERMAGVLALIVTLAEGGPAPMTAAELLNEIGLDLSISFSIKGIAIFNPVLKMAI